MNPKSFLSNFLGSFQKWKLCENSSPKLGEVPAGQRSMTRQK